VIVRDPEMVSCAQRAASELERAWSRWRHSHGLGEPTPEPVASYVTHSIDHPWGRPRVVLGLDAEEARALAALLGREDAPREQENPPAVQSTAPIDREDALLGMDTVPLAREDVPLGREDLPLGREGAPRGREDALR
jgi:hypothetical protein